MDKDTQNQQAADNATAEAAEKMVEQLLQLFAGQQVEVCLTAMGAAVTMGVQAGDLRPNDARAFALGILQMADEEDARTKEAAAAQPQLILPNRKH